MLRASLKIGDVFSNPVVSPDKLKYLLDLEQDNKSGRGKAKFFTSLGFSFDNPGQFIEFIKSHPVPSRFEKEKDDKRGKKLVFLCNINTPFGKEVCIRSVWQIDKGKKRPRLLTAYPRKQ